MTTEPILTVLAAIMANSKYIIATPIFAGAVICFIYAWKYRPGGPRG